MKFFARGIILVASVLFFSFPFSSARAAMADPATIINTLKGAVAHECDNYEDGGGKRYCECTSSLNGQSFTLNVCKAGNRVLYNDSPDRLIGQSETISVSVSNQFLGTSPCSLSFTSGFSTPSKRVQCQIVVAKKPDGCQCQYTYVYQPMGIGGKSRTGVYDLVVDWEDRSSIFFSNGRPDEGAPMNQLKDFAQKVGLYDNSCLLDCADNKANCKLGTPTSFGSSPIPKATLKCSKPVYRGAAKCCCKEVEKGSVTTKYSCSKKNGFDSISACGEKELSFPVPADGTCDSLTYQGKGELKPTNLGIGKDKLLSEAATLNQLPNFGTPAALIGQAIKVMLSLMGSIALALYVWSGILWTTAAGSSERIETSKKILVWTTAGVVAILSSYILVQFIFKTLG